MYVRARLYPRCVSSSNKIHAPQIRKINFGEWNQSRTVNSIVLNKTTTAPQYCNSISQYWGNIESHRITIHTHKHLYVHTGLYSSCKQWPGTVWAGNRSFGHQFAWWSLQIYVSNDFLGDNIFFLFAHHSNCFWLWILWLWHVIAFSLAVANKIQGTTTVWQRATLRMYVWKRVIGTPKAWMTLIFFNVMHVCACVCVCIYSESSG